MLKFPNKSLIYIIFENMKNFSRSLVALTVLIATVSWTETPTYDRQSQSEIEKHQFYDEVTVSENNTSFYIYTEKETDQNEVTRSARREQPPTLAISIVTNNNEVFLATIRSTETETGVINYADESIDGCGFSNDDFTKPVFYITGYPPECHFYLSCLFMSGAS